MGICFKLFGKAFREQEIIDCTGSAFFVAEHYLLTCKHLVSALSPGDELIFCYGKNEYSAALEAVAIDCDLVLLYSETSAQEEWIFSLDRVAPKGEEAVVYGYPHGRGLDEQRGMKIGTEFDKEVPLTNANGVTIGFSGGPVCLATDLRSAIGVISTITVKDEYGRRMEGASFVSARVALELWGEQYGLLEKRFKIKADAFGRNDFVYSAQMTAYQDPHGYLRLLREFLEDERPVLWWAIVAPGGAGKSRLCYELARSLNSSWCCKLLQAGQLKKDNLQALYENAGRSFLLIADYAYTDTGQLGEWLEECARILNGPRIRVLLLQREAGKDNIGWQESLLRCHRNLIKLHYQEDLQLNALGREDTIAIMRSYAENVGGGQIDAPALYKVLENVDPGLIRPLFAMFITDAVLNGEDPRGWDRENALAYFTQREKDVIDRALGKEDAIVAKMLLAIATIVNGFTFDVDLLDTKPLCDLGELIDLSEKAYFGSRLNNARLADRNHGCYTVKPMKPDLLGEFYVLDCFREMLDDQQQEEAATALLEVAKKADIIATRGFLTRLFADYETDEKLVFLCCGEDDLLQDSVSNGLIMRQDTVLLRNLYKISGTEFWMVEYAKGLLNTFNYQIEWRKKEFFLNELRELYRKSPCNKKISELFAMCLTNAIAMQNDLEKEVELLDELRQLYRGEQLGNSELAGVVAMGLVNALIKQTELVKTYALLDELRKMHSGELGNVKISEALTHGLYKALYDESDPEKAAELLDELRKLHSEEPGNGEVSEAKRKN